MNLIVQGPDLPTPDLKHLAKLTGARAIEAVTPTAFRLVATDPGPREAVAAFCDEHGYDHGWVPAERRIDETGLEDLVSLIVGRKGH